MPKSNELRIYRPCISKYVSQGWGENSACLDKETGEIFSTAYVCPEGSISYYKYVGMRGHNGIDIPGWRGEEIYHSATFDGWMRAEKDIAGGLGVDVVSEEPLFFLGEPPKGLKEHVLQSEDGFYSYIKMRYWHLQSVVGHDGKKVSCGDTIGLMGNTGASSGTHLHFAPKWCDEEGNGLLKNNGYYGAFDPTLFYFPEFTAREHQTFLGKERKLKPHELKEIKEQINLIQRAILLIQKLIHHL